MDFSFILERVIIGTVFGILILILPIVPSRYLGKLPSSKASVEGPYKNLLIKLQGPLALYFIALTIIGTPLTIYLLKSKPEYDQYEMWKVVGWIELQGNDNESKVEYIVRPRPDLFKVDPGTSGDFTITGVVLPTKTTETIPPTKLSVEMDGYGTLPICLDREHYRTIKFGDCDRIKVKYDEKTKTIAINDEHNPLVLEKEEVPYNPGPP